MKLLLIIVAFVVILIAATERGAQIMDVASAARAAGFAGEDLIIAVAVALAESGGNPQAYNSENDYFDRHGLSQEDRQGKGSIGLWQIFSYAHPEFAGWDLTDPAQNARAAYSIYRAAGNSFSPWSTFTSDKYSTHLQQAANEVNA